MRTCSCQAWPWLNLNKFLCSYNNVCGEGNSAAHEADQEDVQAAVLRKPIALKDRWCLEKMYMYTYSSL